MAHAIVEYSANLEDKVDLDNLISTVHEACLNTGVFPLTGMRTRGARRDYYKICLLYTSPSPRDRTRSRMPSSA